MKSAGLIVVLALLWFGVNLAEPVGPAFLLWLPTIASTAVLTWSLVRAARDHELARPTRLFWGRLAVAAGAAGAGLSGQAYDIWRHPDAGGTHTTPVLIGGAAVAQLVIVYALLRLPLGDRRPGDLLRLLLDAGTVMLAAGVFLWHFQTRQLIGAEGFGLVGSLVLTVTGMVAVFSVVKVMLSGHRFVDRTALRLLATAVFVGTWAPAVQPYLELSHPYLFATMVGNPACFFVAVLAAAHQIRAGRGTFRPGAERRPFSLIPYAAVAAVQALLLVVAFGDGVTADPGVVVVAVLVTVLVAVRQVMVLIENGRLVRRLDHSATHDPLTGLANRVLFHRRLAGLLDGPCDRPVAVALLDLDGFKQVNDTLGHAAGDRLLIAVAERLTASVRDDDLVARLGGDEFVVVMADATADTAEQIVTRMIDTLSEPIVVDGHPLSIGASVGIAVGGPAADAGELLRRADIAMYAAKDLPHSGFTHFGDPGPQASTKVSVASTDGRRG